eukprot:TRINITY_DN12352_c0_g1_i1.p1 TRINITY_DN12352_c0_g1~~TRINITY_DN12352_c0_g1_i1.p1  ORF type:complete len:521 (-),score=113.57 TRINITY_DN12352_c0_g1_i1:58-1620(-)
MGSTGWFTSTVQHEPVEPEPRDGWFSGNQDKEEQEEFSGNRNRKEGPEPGRGWFSGKVNSNLKEAHMRSLAEILGALTPGTELSVLLGIEADGEVDPKVLMGEVAAALGIHSNQIRQYDGPCQPGSYSLTLQISAAENQKLELVRRKAATELQKVELTNVIAAGPPVWHVAGSGGGGWMDGAGQLSAETGGMAASCLRLGATAAVHSLTMSEILAQAGSLSQPDRNLLLGATSPALSKALHSIIPASNQRAELYRTPLTEIAKSGVSTEALPRATRRAVEQMVSEGERARMVYSSSIPQLHKLMAVASSAERKLLLSLVPLRLRPLLSGYDSLPEVGAMSLKDLVAVLSSSCKPVRECMLSALPRRLQQVCTAMLAEQQGGLELRRMKISEIETLLHSLTGSEQRARISQLPPSLQKVLASSFQGPTNHQLASLPLPRLLSTLAALPLPQAKGIAARLPASLSALCLAHLASLPLLHQVGMTKLDDIPALLHAAQTKPLIGINPRLYNCLLYTSPSPRDS